MEQSSALVSRDSGASFHVPGVLRQVSQWSNQFRGEDGEPPVRPPSGLRFRRTSSTATTEKPFDRQASTGLPRSDSSRSQTVCISPAAYHGDLKQDIKAKLNFNILIAVVVVVFGSSFQFGFNIGVLNPQATHIKSFFDTVLTSRKGEVNSGEVTVLWSLTTALFIPGGLIGSLLGGWMADRFGRKRTLLFSHLFILLGAPFGSACVAANSPEMLMISRVLFGLNAGLGNCAAPMFVSEIAPYRFRGALSTVPQLFITIGILMSSIFGLPQLLGTHEYWQYLFMLETIPAVTALAAIPFLHETPRFLLLIKQERSEANKALMFYRKTKDVTAEMEEMDTEFQASSKAAAASDAFTWKRLFTTSCLRRPLLITVMLQVMQQFSGINAVFFYSEGIFKSAGVPDEHIPYAILGTNIVNVFMTVITVPLIDRLGRRPLLMIPMLIMAVDLILLTICLKLQPSYSWLGIVSVISVIIYVIGFAVGLGPIPMMLAAELFRQGPRPKAMALAGIVNWIGTFIIAMAFEPLKEVTGHFTFIIFCILLVLFTVFTFLCVPETKNLTFEEIANKFAPAQNIEVEMVGHDGDDDEHNEVDGADFNGPQQQQQQEDIAVVNFSLGTTSPMIERPKVSFEEDEMDKSATQSTRF